MIRAVLALVLLVAACGCWSQPDPSWVEDDVQAANERILWQATLLSLEKNGFPPSAEQDREHGKAMSGWRTSLQPFKSKGERTRCEVQLTQTGERAWHVQVRVLRETNEELDKPLDASRAKWKPQADDDNAASRVLRYLQLLLGGGAEPAAKPAAQPAAGTPQG